jgi:hypothetical protein
VPRPGKATSYLVDVKLDSGAVPAGFGDESFRERHQAEVVEVGRPEPECHGAKLADQRIGQSPGVVELLFGTGRGPGGTLDPAAQLHDQLKRLVVQLVRDPPAFLLLGGEDGNGPGAGPAVPAGFFGDVLEQDLGEAVPFAVHPVEDRDPMQVAVFPLTVPYLLNPAGIVVLVTLSAEASSIAVLAVAVGVLVAVLAFDIIVFRGAVQVSSKLDTSRMLVTEKVFGFLLAALGVQLILNGLSDVGVIHLTTGH